MKEHQPAATISHAFSVMLAQRFGDREAIALNSFAFWYTHNKAKNLNFHEGRWWTYNTQESFLAIWPYWTIQNTKTVINSLIRQGLLMKAQLRGTDRTVSYTLTEYGLWQTGLSETPPDPQSCPPGAEISLTTMTPTLRTEAPARRKIGTKPDQLESTDGHRLELTNGYSSQLSHLLESTNDIGENQPVTTRLVGSNESIGENQPVLYIDTLHTTVTIFGITNVIPASDDAVGENQQVCLGSEVPVLPAEQTPSTTPALSDGLSGPATSPYADKPALTGAGRIKKPKPVVPDDTFEADGKTYKPGHYLRLAMAGYDAEYFWSAKEAVAARDLSAKLAYSFRVKNQREATGEELGASLIAIIRAMSQLHPASRFQSLPILNQKYNDVVRQLKELRQPTSSTPPTGTPTQRPNYG
jgi:hypothetical protein